MVTFWDNIVYSENKNTSIFIRLLAFIIKN